MNTDRFTRLQGLAFGCVVALAAVQAMADITLEEKISLEGSGVMSIANMSGRTVNTIAADRARMESDMQMQSRLMRTFARGLGPTAEIIRLDTDTIYNLDLKKQRYTEMTFAEMRAASEAAIAKAEQQAAQQGEQPATPSPIDESQCDWSEPTAEVRKTGETARIAGHEASRVAIVASQSCTDRKTKQVCDVAFVIDQWLAPDFDGGAEAEKFYKAYAQKMGLATGVSKGMAERAETYFGRYKDMWTKVGKELGDVKGYPVRSSFALGFGGPQCASVASAQGQAANGAGSDPAAPGSESVAVAGGEAVGREVASDAGRPGLGSLAGAIGGRIAGSMFGKKKAEPAPAADPAPAAGSTAVAQPAALTPPGVDIFLRINSELVSVTRGPAPAATFEVPPGFTKTAN